MGSVLVDISGWQDQRGTIDFPRLKAAGIAGVIIKASEGTSTSQYFVRDATQASAAGLLVGAYAFTRPDVGQPEPQADVFAAIASQAPRLDWWADDAETGGSVGAASWGDWHGRFCSSIDSHLASRVAPSSSLFYSAAWCEQFGWGFDSRVTSRLLWVAQYSSSRPGPLPGWTSVALWQDRSNATYPGIVGPVDEDLVQVGMPPFTAQTGVIAVGSPHLTDVVASVTTPDGSGSYDIEANGGLWPTGNAPTFNRPDGSAGSMAGRLAPGRSVVGFALYAPGGQVRGYWFVQDDGGVFPFGAAPGYGSPAGQIPAGSCLGIVAHPTGSGYVVKQHNGGAWPFGPQPPAFASEA